MEYKLKLNEKYIRKGKPIGLPYVGSKKKISKKIVGIIKQNFGVSKKVYDIFGGGGAITAELLVNSMPVHYNDLDKPVTDMFKKVLSQDREWIKTLIVSRAEFEEIKKKENRTTDDELKLLINSFGNNRKNYLYSKEKSDIKYNLAKEIIEIDDVFGGYKQTKTYKKAVTDREEKLSFIEKEEKCRALQQLQQLQNLEQLQRLQQLERLQNLEQPKVIDENFISVTNKSYEYFSNVKDSILYLDPPYENTSQAAYIGQFDSLKFYDWAYEMSKKNIVLLSSYEVSDSRFGTVYEFKNARSTLSATGKRNDKYEKLFMVKKDWSRGVEYEQLKARSA